MSTQEMPFPPRLIRASAGTGKTYQLSNRLIALLVAGEQPHRILATTFTKKAAAEIRERVFCRIAEAALEESQAAELSAAISHPNKGSKDFQSLLTSLAREQQRLAICTLDSFFIQIAKSFALELGLPLEWDLLDESAVRSFNEEALHRVIATKSSRMIPLIKLFAARAHTRSVYQTFREDMYSNMRLFRESNYAQWNWLRVKGGLPRVEVLRLLEELKEFQVPLTKAGKPDSRWKKAIADSVELYGTSSWESFLKKGLPSKILDDSMEYYKTPLPDELVHIMRPLIGHASAFVLRSLRRRTVASYFLFKYLEDSLSSLKHQRRMFNFDDISKTLARSIREYGCEDIFYRLDSYLHHLLLDEFQDTSLEQWQILEPFADEILAKSGHEHSFFCVGDVKQAIYSWRGGESAIFDSLERNYEQLQSPDRLDASWRSAPIIIETVNTVFSSLANNTALTDFKDAAETWLLGFSTHSTEQKSYEGHVQLRVQRNREDAESDEEVAAEDVANVIGELKKHNSTQSIGVLVRRNKLVLPFIQALRRRGINASQEGGTPLSDSPIVSLFLAIIQLADHPGDRLAQFRIAHSAFADVFDVQWPMDATQTHALSLELRTTLQSEGYGKSIFRWLLAVKEQLSERDYRTVLQLSELAYAYQPRANLRSRDFIRFVEQTKVEDPISSSVTVMTIHKSKGLEFDSVVLPELNQKLAGSSTDDFIAEREHPLAPPSKVTSYPNELVRGLDPQLASIHRKDRSKKVTESLSLLYVALTRARHGLYLSIPSKETAGAKDTFAGVLLSALVPEFSSCEGSTIFERGKFDWSAPDTSQPLATKELERRSVPLSPRPKHRRRSLSRVSPSVSQADHSTELEALPSPKNAAAMRRGSAVHKLFEQVEWIEDFSLSQEEMRSCLIEAGTLEEEISTLSQLFVSALDAKDIRNALSREAYTKSDHDEILLFRELPFAFRQDNAIVKGKIDRLVLTIKDAKVTTAHLMDFKTDHLQEVSEASLSLKAEDYKSQIEMYCDAVTRLFDVPRNSIRAELLFVRSGAAVEI